MTALKTNPSNSPILTVLWPVYFVQFRRVKRETVAGRMCFKNTCWTCSPKRSSGWEKHCKSVGEGPRLTSKEGRKASFVQKERKHSDAATLFYVQTRASLADCIANGQDRRGAGWWRASPLPVPSPTQDQVTIERWWCQEEWMQEITSGVGRGRGITGTENDPRASV